MAKLQKQLREAFAAAGSSEAAIAERLRRTEAEWEQRVKEAEKCAQQTERELSSRCQLLTIEKLAQEQAAKQAAAKQQAAEERCAAAEARWRQLSAELDSTAGQAQQLPAARRQAEAAADAARQLRQQLLEQHQQCEELEAALRGEQERSNSQAARAETAEVAQQGLGTHAKAAHARLQQQQVGVWVACSDVAHVLGLAGESITCFELGLLQQNLSPMSAPLMHCGALLVAGGVGGIKAGDAAAPGEHWKWMVA